MNQERFKAIKIIMQRAQGKECPVAPIKATLYNDTVSGRKVFVNEFKNNSEKKVLSCVVKISCFDENVKLLGTIKDYKYTDLNIASGEEFGLGKIIACPAPTINSLVLTVTHVELEDDYYWDAEIGKVMSHADSIEEEIEIEMAPMIDDMGNLADEVARNIATNEAVPEQNNVVEPVVESVAKTVVESVAEPVVGPITEPVAEPIAEPITEPVAEPVAGPITEPVAEPVAEPITESVAEPVAAFKQENAATLEETADEVVKVQDDAVENIVEKQQETGTQEVINEEVDPIKEAAAQLAAARMQAEAARNETVVTESVVNQEKTAVVENQTEPKAEETKKPIEVELNFENGRSKKSKKPIPKGVKIAVGIVLTITLLFVAVVAFKKYSDYSNYNRAAAFMANGDYEYAINTYTKLGDYADSKTLLVEAKIAYANSLKEAGDFAGAIEEYQKIGGQEARINECYDAWARNNIEIGEHQAALDMINKPELTFSEDTVKYVKYGMALNLYENQYYEEAVVFFAELRGYESADELMNDSYYKLGVTRMENSDYEKALAAFGVVANYKDTATKIKDVKYLMGLQAVENRNYEDAVKCFEEVAGYKDANELIIDCYYKYGTESLDKSNYEVAMTCFNKIKGNETYEDLEDKYNQALYKYVLAEMKLAVTPELLEKLDELPKNFEDVATVKRNLKKYIEHVGEYEWKSSNDKEVNEKGGFEEHIIVTLAYNEGEITFLVDGHPVDLKLFVYKSGTDSDTYTMLNTSTITRTFNGKLHTYKKIKQE